MADTKSLVKIAKALTDPTRLHILQEIARATCIGCIDLYDYVPISQPSMSQHLKVLGEAGLINTVKEGRNIFLSINAARFQEMESFFTSLNIK